MKCRLFSSPETIFLCCALYLISFADTAKDIGSVDTKFNLLSPDDSVRVEMFNDPKITGVACYLSRAVTGGLASVVGVAEDTSDASIDCRQVGPVRITEPFDEGESVFRERRSFMFKSMKVIRFCDTDHNTIVYLVYSERVIEGSPKNSVTAVPITRWAGQSEDQALELCQYDD